MPMKDGRDTGGETNNRLIMVWDDVVDTNLPVPISGRGEIVLAQETVYPDGYPLQRVRGCKELWGWLQDTLHGPTTISSRYR